MNTGKDSPEVVRFMALFAKLREWTDDRPEGLADIARGDDGLSKLCGEVSWAAHVLQMNERRRRELFAAPVDPTFISAWRDYENRYDAVLAGIWFSEVFGEIEVDQSARSPASRWDMADREGADQASSIEGAIDFAEFNAEQVERWGDGQADFIEQMKDGAAAWARLRENTGFDLRGVFRRRELVPFVLVPRLVDAKQGGQTSLMFITCNRPITRSSTEQVTPL